MASTTETPKTPVKTPRCAPLAPRPHPHPGAAIPTNPVPSTSPPPVVKLESSSTVTPEATKKRQFSKSDEETLVRLWKDNIEQYYKGVRRRVLEKMTAHMNSAIASPPFFALKQVENKLSYMEKRYRSVLDEMRRQGYSCGEDDPSSVRISCERKFCLFYDVHDILRDVVGNEAYSKRSAQSEHTAGAKSNSRSASTTPASSAAPLPRVPDISVTPVTRVPDVGNALHTPPPPPELDETGDQVLESLPPLPLLESDENNSGEAERHPVMLKRKAVSDIHDTVGAIPAGTSQGKRRRAANNSDTQSAAARIAQVAQSFVAMSERLLASDEEQRREAFDITKRELDVRRQELELKHKETDARLAESRNSALAERIAALRFLATSLGAAGDVQGQARALKKMEDLVGSQ